MSDGTFGYSSDLPEEIREIFMWLCQDVATLHQTWDFYLELFSDEENIALMNDYAPASFQIIERSLRHDMTMAISRLGDRADQSRNPKNLSLTTLVQKCNHIPNVQALLKEFREACDPIRVYRNKRVGHRDLETTVKPEILRSESIGRSQIEKILELAGIFLNTIYGHYANGEFWFEVLAPGGADALIHALNLMKKERVERRRNLYGDDQR